MQRDKVDNMKFYPVSGNIGAEVSGFDLAKDLEENQVSSIRSALLDHKVLFFRDQKINEEQLIAFGKRFGELNTHPFISGTDKYPEIIKVLTEPNTTANFGGYWHHDVTFLENPDMATILHAKEVPDFGGDTLFANQHLAYDSLSDKMKEFLSGLHAVHDAGLVFAGNGYYSKNSHSIDTKNEEQATTKAIHPVIRTHPETGSKALFVNYSYTNRIVELSKKESKTLLKFLFDHCTSEEFTCRFRWQKDSIAMWDNRSVKHYALFDYKGQRRVMHRVTIKGDKPF